MLQLKDAHLLPSSLKMDSMNPYSQGNNSVDGKLVGWDQKVKLFIVATKYFQSKS